MMFSYVLYRKQFLLDYPNITFTWWPNWFIAKGLVHDFGQNLKTFSYFFCAKKACLIGSKPFKTIKILILHSRQIRFFLML